jgi:hypothetical protein
MLKGIPADTTLEAARVQFDVLRRLGTEGRARLLLDLMENLRATLEAGIRLRHPDYNPEQIRWALLRLRLGDALFRQCFPDMEVVP